MDRLQVINSIKSTATQVLPLVPSYSCLVLRREEMLMLVVTGIYLSLLIRRSYLAPKKMTTHTHSMNLDGH